MKIRSKRPGLLVVTDAKLKLRPSEVVEVHDMTPQLTTALERGFVEEVGDDRPVGAPKSEDPAPALPADYERLSASEAIEYIDGEEDQGKLSVIANGEKRKTVLDALRKKLQEAEGHAAQ